MKKKLWGIILSAAMTVSMITPIMAENVPTLSGKNVSIEAGEEFIMPIVLENGESVTQFMMDMSFDRKYIEAIELVDGNVTDFTDETGNITVIAKGLNTAESGSEIFTYKFKAAENITNEVTTSVNVKLESFSGAEEIRTENGVVSIKGKAEPTATPVVTPEPTESPEPTPEVTPEPTATPEPEETPKPTETPAPSETPKPEKKEQQIVLEYIPDKTYGDESFKIEATADSGKSDFTYESSDESVATVDSEGNVTVVGAGECTFTVSVGGNDEYEAAELEKDFTVNKKILKVYPNDLTITYGEALPTNLIAFEGFVNEDDEEVISKQVVVDGLPETVVPGTYNLTLGGITADNYKVEYYDGTVTINKKALTVKDIEVYDKLADGTVDGAINKTSGTLEGINSGDSVKVNLDSAKAVFASAEAGEGIEVTVSDYYLDGKDAMKYTLENTTFATIADITDSMAAEVMAARITSIPAVEKDQRNIVLPVVGSGFDVSIDSVSNAEVVDMAGNIGYIDDDTEVQIVLKISKDDDEALTAPITIIIPASTKCVVSQGNMAITLSGTGTYYKGQEVTVSVPSGYKVRSWMINDSKVGGQTTSHTFEVEEDCVVEADAFYHRGGSLAANVVSRVTSSVDSNNRIAAGTMIELETSTDDATIYYTTDGNTPNTLSNVYKDGIVVDKDTVIKAIAVKKGMNNSQVVTYNYTVRYAETKLRTNANGINYMKAYEDNTFRPNQAATRYEVIAALDKLFEVEDIHSVKKFSDVDAEYEDIVEKFANVGIISGYEDGTFRGHRSITRAEFVTMLTKAWKIDENQNYTNIFNDTGSHWARNIIGIFAGKNYVSGYPDGGFHPDEKVTRAEVVSVINRMLGVSAVSTSQKYIDLAPSHWAYSNIMAVAY